jgi:hypothetical protein
LLYKLKSLELSRLKGQIGEHLAKNFIHNTLAPKLVNEEGWDFVILSNNDYKKHVWAWNTKLFAFDAFRKDFIIHGFCAHTKLLVKYAMVADILTQRHCTPDGLLFKLRKTGVFRTVKPSEWPPFFASNVTYAHGTDRLTFPIVEGNVEIVEIKCGRYGRLMAKQREVYNQLIVKGIPLRIIRVKIVSFDYNKFLVEEKKFERFV